MLEKENDITSLIWKHLNGTISDSERKLLADWAGRSTVNQNLLQAVDDNEQLFGKLKLYFTLKGIPAKSLHAEFKKTLPHEHIASKSRNALWNWMAAACTLAVVMTASYFLLIKDRGMPAKPSVTSRNADIPPGSPSAKLTLDDGTTLLLDSKANRELVAQGNTIVKNSNGQLIYSTKERDLAGKAMYNTLSTGRAETYSTVLSDGSRIWLNAESSIRFPVQFAGNERRIQVTGEAYLEVAHNPKIPFRVEAPGITIDVLGTHFSVNAYTNEKVIKTSLLEGKVKVTTKNKQTQVLTPGQQVQVDNKSNNLRLIPHVDVQSEVAWKDGILSFASADLSGVLRKIERWYNIDVRYDDVNGSGRTYSGQIESNLPLSVVLKNLEMMTQSEKFRIEGRTVIVTSKE